MKYLFNRLFILIIITLFSNVLIYSLDVTNLDISPELYKHTYEKILLKRAYVYKHFNNFNKAQQQYDELIKFNPENKEYYKYLKKELDYRIKNQNISKIVTNLIPVYSSERIKKIFEQAEKSNNNIEKLKYYKAILVHEKNNQEAIKGIGKTYIEMKKYLYAKRWLLKIEDDSAKKMIQKIDYLLNSSVHIIQVKVKDGKEEDLEKLNKKIDLLIKDGNREKAERLLLNTIKEYPANYDYTYRLAELYLNMSRYNESLDYLNKTILLNKDMYEAYYLKGEILSKLGEFDQALNSFKKIIKIAPVNSKYYRLSNNMIKLLSTN